MESEPILSREEIETLLSAIRAPEETAPRPPVEPVDFRRPRRLLSTQLERLRSLHEPFLEAVAKVCERGLNAPVRARLLDPEESTPAEILGGLPGDSLLARAGDVLIDPSPRVAFALVERALGARTLTRPPDRPLRDLEAELLTPVIDGILGALRQPPGVRWRTAADLAREAWPDGSFAVLVVEILAEGVLGDILVAVPASRFDPVARPPIDSGATPGVDIEVAARFPLAALKLGDLRDLAPGDLLVWSGDAAPEVTVEVSRKPKFTGRPGTIGGNAAVEIVKPAGTAPSAASLVRVSGGGYPACAPDVPVEIRAVLAERAMSLRDLGGLRPGALIEFNRSCESTAEIRLGRRILARGPIVRTGDRLAVRIETDTVPGRPNL